MTVSEFAAGIGARILTGEIGLERQVTGMYVCDLLSWVMSHTGKGDAWITVHTHLNIVAVSVLTELSCIIIPEGIKVEEVTVNRAMQEGVPILNVDSSAYKICCIAHEAGI